MNESITIDRFLGLPHLSLDFKPFTVLIGPQATGKSVVAKLCYFAKNITWDVFSAIENDHSKSDLDQSLRTRFLDYFPSSCWGENSFAITYQHGDGKISIKKAKGKNAKLKISIPDFWVERLEDLKIQYREKVESTSDSADFKRFEFINKIRNSLTNSATEKFGDEIAFRQLFVPAGRSFFSNLQSSIFSFLSSNNAMDPFLKEFGSVYENIKRFQAHFMEDDGPSKEFAAKAKKLREHVLCGRYLSEKGKDYLHLLDGRRISLGNCSSGQQETLPLALILGSLPAMGRSGYSIYIEEPEAHLFPSAQRSVLELIALTFNSMRPKMQTLVTTHSPYILTALNNLVQAGRLYEQKLKPSENAQLNSLVPKEFALPTGSVAAYSMSATGIVNITDGDSGLIDAAAIDSVSEEIAVQFDELLSISQS